MSKIGIALFIGLIMGLFMGLILGLIGASVHRRSEPLRLEDFPPPAPSAPITVKFSPKGGCTEAVVAAIASAKAEVLVQDYSFTSEPIAGALIAARGRGVSVRVIMDKSVLKEKSVVDELFAAGIEVWIDSRHAIAHNKIMIVDGWTVLSGSFNYTNQAEAQNAENLLVIPPGYGVAALYVANWKAHLAHSVRFAGRAPAPPGPATRQRR